MIRPSTPDDFESILATINDGAQAYRGIIPADRWIEPYMSVDKLQHEIQNGVRFFILEHDGLVAAVMGIQHVQDVTLIRHAYVRTAAQRHGYGARLLEHLRQTAQGPVLIGTWAAAAWAIRFYQRHGFQQVSPTEKNRLLARYWNVPARQVETSIVLADQRWYAEHPTLVPSHL